MKERISPYISVVCCKPSYNVTHEPPWETDSPLKASVTKRPIENEMIELFGPNRCGGRVTDPELANERILTNTPKSAEQLYSGAQVVGPEAKRSEEAKYEDENSYGRLW